MPSKRNSSTLTRRRPRDSVVQLDLVAPGQVFYSVRLWLRQTASVGAVFDGTQPGPLFAAAIRDQFGDDFVNQGEFGVGKLEVR